MNISSTPTDSPNVDARPPASSPPSEEEGEVDSALGDDVESLTESLNPEALRFRYAQGRRYNAFEDASYQLPNDSIEQKRLELQHQMWFLTLDDHLHLSPISSPQEVLDIGTGTGNWAIDFADKYPSARVLGTDLSPIQPNFVPPNCSFMVEDSEKEDWTYNRKFDLIHTRAMLYGIKDWPRYFHRCYENLSPGGWVEAQEIALPYRLDQCCDDGTVTESSFLVRLSREFYKAMRKLGFEPENLSRLKAIMIDAGFVDVHEKSLKWPWNGWSEDQHLKCLGEMSAMNLSQYKGLESMTLGLLGKVLEWNEQRLTETLEEGRASIRDKSVHFYVPVKVIYGRKPSIDD